MSRRALLPLLLGMTLACGEATQQVARKKIRVATQPYLALAPIHIAAAESIFAKHGLDVELVQMTRPNDAIPMLITGDIDVLSSAAQAALFNAAARGEPIRAVAERGFYDARGACTHLALVVRPGLDTARVAQVAKRLSHDRQAAMAYVTERMLARAGLTIEGLEGATEVPHAAELDALKGAQAGHRHVR